MPRNWFSFPRLFHGLVRPGISFNMRELLGSRNPRRRKPKGDGALFILRRPADDALFIATVGRRGDNHPEDAVICFATMFYNVDVAEAARRGAEMRLKSHVGPDGWLTGLSLGQLVDKLEAEIRALGLERIDLSGLDVKAALEGRPSDKRWRKVMAVVLGVIMFLILLGLLVADYAHAGSCRTYSNGPHGDKSAGTAGR
jgi:hypothetical protein